MPHLRLYRPMIWAALALLAACDDDASQDRRILRVDVINVIDDTAFQGIADAAVQDISGIPAVFVRKSKTEFEPRTVKTGRHVNGDIEIIEGISAGDTVVVKGSFLLKSQLMRRSIED